MSQNLPAPIVPAEIDLRDYLYMPLDVRRLLTSETWIDASHEPHVSHALICLWAESWHQVPAASLPDNDRVLARLAMCDMALWESIKAKVLRGWIKCSDGLLYHPVVAEKAIEAWSKKRKQKARTSAATAARARQRHESQGAGDEERNGQRDDERNVHQGRGEEKRGEDTTLNVPESKKDARQEGYVFQGDIIRLTQTGFDRWQSSFPTIRDLRAELAAIDAKLRDDPPPNFNPDKWFGTVAAWLRKKHQRLSQEGRTEGTAPAAGPVDPEESQWRARLRGYAGGRKWRGELWGPEPTAGNCQCPRHILAEFRTALAERTASALGR